MRLRFKTLAGQEVRVESSTMHLVNEGDGFEEDLELLDQTRYKVIVGDEYFIYPVSEDEFVQLSKAFDIGGMK